MVGVVGVEEEDVGETWCSVGFTGRKPGSLGDVERKLRVALDRRRRTVAEEFTGEEGVDATRERGNGVAVLRAVLGGMASRGVGRGVSRGGAGQAKRPRPMDALPTRGRRSDGRDDWARGSGGVTAPGAWNRRARGLGAEDARVIACRPAFERGSTENVRTCWSV